MRQSSDFFRAVLDNVPGSLLVLDHELRVFSANKLFLSTFQVSPEKTVNKFIYDLGNGQWNIPKLRKLLERVLSKKEAVTDFEVERDFESIGRKAMMLNARIVSSAGDAQPMLLLSIDDITERKQAEKDTARLTAIVECSDDAIIRKDLNGTIETWNPGAERLFGYTPREAIGQSITMLIPQDRADEEPAILERIRRGEHIEHYESVRRRKDGRLVEVSLTISPIVDAHGQIVGASKIAHDITERRQAEDALRESNERFRALFDSSPMAVFVCDRDAVIQNCNRCAIEMWGREPKCGVEKHCGSVALWLPNGEPLPHEQSPVMGVLRTGIPVSNVEVFIERPDGSRLPVLVNFAALKNAQGEITGAITNFVDITERKQAEEALRQSHIDLQAHAEELERFNRTAVGREVRMIALKKEVNEFCRQRGEAARYPLEFERDERGTITSVPGEDTP